MSRWGDLERDVTLRTVRRAMVPQAFQPAEEGLHPYFQANSDPVLEVSRL